MYAVYYSEAYTGSSIINVAAIISVGAGLISLGAYVLLAGGHFLKWFDKKNKDDMIMSVAIVASFILSLVFTVISNLVARYNGGYNSTIVGAILYESGLLNGIISFISRVCSNLYLLAFAFKFYKTNKISALVIGGAFAFSVISIEIFSAIQYIGGFSYATSQVSSILVTLAHIAAIVFAFIEEKADEE